MSADVAIAQILFWEPHHWDFMAQFSSPIQETPSLSRHPGPLACTVFPSSLLCGSVGLCWGTCVVLHSQLYASSRVVISIVVSIHYRQFLWPRVNTTLNLWVWVCRMLSETILMLHSGSSRLSFQVHDLTRYRWLARFTVWGMNSLPSSRPWVQLGGYWLPPRYMCH